MHECLEVLKTTEALKSDSGIRSQAGVGSRTRVSDSRALRSPPHESGLGLKGRVFAGT